MAKEQDSQRKSTKSVKTTPGPAGLDLAACGESSVLAPLTSPPTCLQRAQLKPCISVSRCRYNKLPQTQ